MHKWGNNFSLPNPKSQFSTIPLHVLRWTKWGMFHALEEREKYGSCRERNGFFLPQLYFAHRSREDFSYEAHPHRWEKEDWRGGRERRRKKWGLSLLCGSIGSKIPHRGPAGRHDSDLNLSMWISWCVGRLKPKPEP